MSIFRKKGKGNPDLSQNLKSADSWCLRQYERLSAGHVVALTYDPVLDVYACGIDNGEIHLYGAPPVHFVFTIPSDARDNVSQVQIFPAPRRLVCIAKGSMIIWSLDGNLVNEPISITSIPSNTAFIGASTEHSHALIPHPDGTVHTFDVLHLCESPTTVIPSPDAAEGVIMDLLQNRNLDLLAVATYGSVYLWKFSLYRLLSTFTLPGNQTLRPVCLAFHPSEDILLAGLQDGTLVFWDFIDSLPLWMTTASELLDEKQSDGKKSEPVFKLLWTASAGGSNLIILGGRPAGRSRLVTLHFDASPFSSREQLTPQSVTTYEEYRSGDLKDFIYFARSDHLLALADNGVVTLLPGSQASMNPRQLAEEFQTMTLEKVGLPYELYPPSSLGQLCICSNDRIRVLESNNVKQKANPLANGALALPRFQKHGPDPRLSKYDEGRLAALLHEDGIIRFHDISSKLLLDPDPLTSAYPSSLPSLSIYVKSLLDEPLLWVSLGDTAVSQIVQTHFIPEALELYVILENGAILVWKYHKEAAPQAAPANLDPKLLDLSSMTFEASSFRPQFLFSCKEGKVTSLATSEIGFLAAAYESGSVYLIDMRGPRILHRRSQNRNDAVISMRFAICGLNAKSSKRLVLLISLQSGSMVILTITKANSGWSVDPETLEIPVKKSLTSPIACFLIDLLSGEDLEASGHAFGSLHSERNQPNKPDKTSFIGELYRITISKEGIRCDVGFTGPLVKMIEFADIFTAGLVRRNDSSTLVVFTAEAQIHVLSIPHLQPLAKFQAPLSSSVIKSAQLIKGTSDFTVMTLGGIEVWTLSPAPRAENPTIILPKMDRGQQEHGPGLLSWLLGKGQGMTGEEFDNLVAGPSRPRASPVASTSTARVREPDHNELIAATSERGELIGNIAKQTEELEHAAEGMVAQAQRLAARQSKRRRFGF